MSDNKFKYFELVTTALVKANSKTDAEKLVLGRRGIPGEVLDISTEIERISAVEVREMLED